MDGSIYATNADNVEYIKFIGTVRYSHCAGLEAHINYLFQSKPFNNVVIDLEETDILDSTALGLLARIAIELKKQSEVKPVIFISHGELAKILKRVCFDQVFDIIYDEKKLNLSGFKELFVAAKNVDQKEKETLQRVIDAHRNLAKLNKKNETLYKDITQGLTSTR